MNGNRAVKRFRLVRSRAFWFGVPGLVGLLWGWWVSMGYWSWASMGNWELGQSWGDMYVYVEGRPNRRDFHFEHMEGPVDLSAWELELGKKRHEFANRRLIVIPYRWPAVGYALVYAGLLVSRKRKFEKRPVE